MSLLERITIDNDICHGRPCVRHMRWPVEAVLDLLSAGMSPGEIRADHPELEVEDLNACLQYAWPAESRGPSLRQPVAPDLGA